MLVGPATDAGGSSDGGGNSDAGTDAGFDAGNQEPFPTTGTATGVPTFESIGFYWKPSGGSVTQPCAIQYRVAGNIGWKSGLELWFDKRDGEYRGSLVLLKANTTYQVKLSLPGTASPTVSTLTVKTWDEAFPVGRTVTLPATSSARLDLTAAQSGTANGYALYTVGASGSAIIDGANAVDYNLHISGAYIIVRGLTLKGAMADSIRLETGAHDIIIEDCDISGWGRVRDVANNWGVNGDSGIHIAYRANGIDRIIVQRNTIHNARYSTNSWANGHPAGPLGVYFEACSLPDNPTCGSNHVISFNDVHGDATHYFMDGIGGEDNFSTTGSYPALRAALAQRAQRCKPQFRLSLNLFQFRQ